MSKIDEESKAFPSMEDLMVDSGSLMDQINAVEDRE